MFEYSENDLREVTEFYSITVSINAGVVIISGRKDPRMLFQYTHLRAEDVAEKLQTPIRKCWELAPSAPL